MQNKTVFQFISEPSDVNYGGNVHGGSVMKSIKRVMRVQVLGRRVIV